MELDSSCGEESDEFDPEEAEKKFQEELRNKYCQDEGDS